MNNDAIRIIEVGPRDGLQNEAIFVPTKDKVALIDRLAASGLSDIEITSFVSPRAIPQLADNMDVCAQIAPNPNVDYWALVPNEKGYIASQQAKIKRVAVFGAASESFSQRNINCSIAESLQRFAPVVEQAKRDGVMVRGYVSCVLGCPYEGSIAPKKVLLVAQALLEMGVDELSFGDTIGVGTPNQTRALLKLLMTDIPSEKIAMHFHDTYAQAIANIHTSIEEGIRSFDSSVAGLGGCPYAQGASGNVATEDLLYLLHGLGMYNAADIYKVVEAGHLICQQLGKPNQSKVARALLGQAAKARA